MNDNERRQLVKNAVSGDMSAFERLYRQTEKAVYFTCLKLLANKHDAKDVTQDTFITALEKLSSLEDGARFPQWVNVIAINKCRAYFRKQPKDSLEEHIEQGEEFRDDGFIPEDYAADLEKRRVIMHIIDTKLSDVQRQTIVLYYYNGMSISEIAGVMDCPEGTVKYRLSAAREKIKEAVLIYEKENNDRLHAIVPVPVLTRIFRAEAEQISVPDIPLDLSKAASKSSVNKNLKAGGSAMKSALAGKIIAGVAALAVTGGVIATVVINKNSSDDSSVSGGSSSNAIVTTDENISGSETEESESELEDNSESGTNNDTTVPTAVPLEGLEDLKGTIEFGHWEQDGDESNGPEPIVWRIYEKKDGRAYFWSHMVLDYAPFSSENCSWENSDIRAWLNGDFYENAFTDEEKIHIYFSEIDNETAPPTKDYVFLPTPFDATADRFHQDHQQEMSIAAQSRYAELTGKESTHASYWSRIISNNGKPYYIYTLTNATEDASHPYGIIPCIYVAYADEGNDNAGISDTQGDKIVKLSDYFDTDNFDKNKFAGFYTKKGELMSTEDLLNQTSDVRTVSDYDGRSIVYLTNDRKSEEAIFNKDKDTISTLEFISEQLGDPTCIYECQNKLVDSEYALSWDCYAFWFYDEMYIYYHVRLYDGGVELGNIYPQEFTADFITKKNAGTVTAFRLSQLMESFRSNGYTVYGTPIENLVPTV